MFLLHAKCQQPPPFSVCCSMTQSTLTNAGIHRGRGKGRGTHINTHTRPCAPTHCSFPNNSSTVVLSTSITFANAAQTSQLFLTRSVPLPTLLTVVSEPKRTSKNMKQYMPEPRDVLEWAQLQDDYIKAQGIVAGIYAKLTRQPPPPAVTVTLLILIDEQKKAMLLVEVFQKHLNSILISCAYVC